MTPPAGIILGSMYFIYLVLMTYFRLGPLPSRMVVCVTFPTTEPALVEEDTCSDEGDCG
jgi:hypothetical protein